MQRFFHKKRLCYYLLTVISAIGFYSGAVCCAESETQILTSVKGNALAIPPIHLQLEGEMGKRIEANLHNWLFPAPLANPRLIEDYRLRDRKPRPLSSICVSENFGKYLIGAVQALRMTDDTKLYPFIHKLVADFISTQDKDGYMGAYPREERFSGWDVWGHYHCMQGLYMWYKQTGDKAALESALRAADMLCDRFLNGKVDFQTVGSYEMNGAIMHVLGMLYRETGNARYFQMMKEVEAGWSKYGHGDYLQNARRGVDLYKTTPRWETLHTLEGFFELYLATGEMDYKNALLHYWHSIHNSEIHNNGGFSTGENAIGNPYTSGSIETCCIVAWQALTLDALRLEPDSKIADAIELTTWNIALGAQHPSGRWWTYDTPMDGCRMASALVLAQYPHDHNYHGNLGRPEFSCCSVNQARAIGIVSEWAVLEDEQGLYLNYYGPGRIEVKMMDGSPIRINQQTRYPADGNIRITLGLDKPKDFMLRLRIPEWSGKTRVKIGENEVKDVLPGRYLELQRLWKDGDELILNLDMSLRRIVGDDRVNHKASLYYGPLLLTYDQKFNEMEPDAVPTLDARKLEYETAEVSCMFPPIVLFKFRAENGQALYLSDYASTGAHGTYYRSWLPMNNAGGGRIHLEIPHGGESGENIGTQPVINFRWGNAGPQARYTLMVCKDRGMSDIVYQLQNITSIGVYVEREKLALEDNKTYFWNVFIRCGSEVYPSENGPRTLVYAKP